MACGGHSSCDPACPAQLGGGWALVAGGRGSMHDVRPSRRKKRGWWWGGGVGGLTPV